MCLLQALSKSPGERGHSWTAKCRYPKLTRYYLTLPSWKTLRAPIVETQSLDTVLQHRGIARLKVPTVSKYLFGANNTTISKHEYNQQRQRMPTREPHNSRLRPIFPPCVSEAAAATGPTEGQGRCGHDRSRVFVLDRLVQVKLWCCYSCCCSPPGFCCCGLLSSSVVVGIHLVLGL